MNLKESLKILSRLSDIERDIESILDHNYYHDLAVVDVAEDLLERIKRWGFFKSVDLPMLSQCAYSTSVVMYKYGYINAREEVQERNIILQSRATEVLFKLEQIRDQLIEEEKGE